MTKALRLILGDQLNATHSWYKEQNPNVTYLVAELHQEAAYVRHHQQKLCAFFLSMANFAQALKDSKHNVIHLNLDDTQDYKSLPELLDDLIGEHEFESFAYQRPDEDRLLSQLRSYTPVAAKAKGTLKHIDEVDTEHFMLPFDELDDYFAEGKAVRMESFYRKMRKRFDILMRDDEPVGGQWNYDAENRSKLKKTDLHDIPPPMLFDNSVRSINERIERHQIDCFGESPDSLMWPCNRRQAKQLLEFFCDQCLPRFGTFQDAMTGESPHAWSLYHSRLSFALNTKMLHPKDVISAAIVAFEHATKDISLAQVEGFVRQILGWREFIRGIYWANMPRYAQKNELEANRSLPEYFWTGKTKMRCMQHAITQSLDTAYAHHIQRLMVTGNFCLLAGIDPTKVDQWYLGIYIDAIEWVEMPNTRGMCQFADGGLVASKPYAASGSYINRMSDYCRKCHYDVKQRVGEKACPFNSLYWHFMDRHRDRFGRNPRIGMVYRNLDKMDEQTRDSILTHGQTLLDNIDQL